MTRFFLVAAGLLLWLIVFAGNFILPKYLGVQDTLPLDGFSIGMRLILASIGAFCSVAGYVVLDKAFALTKRLQWWRLGLGAPWAYPTTDDKRHVARPHAYTSLRKHALKMSRAIHEEELRKELCDDGIYRIYRNRRRVFFGCHRSLKIFQMRLRYLIDARNELERVRRLFYTAWDMLKRQEFSYPDLSSMRNMLPGRGKFATPDAYRTWITVAFK